MKEEQKIYIRGSKDRPDDIRRILEQHGGKVHGIIDYTFSDHIYYINHDGIIDNTCEGSGLYYFITKYYHEVKLPNNLGCWKKGDILVSNNDSNRFYVFESFAKDGRIFVYLEISKSPIDDKAIRINDIYHLAPYIPCHKANDKKIATFYNILATRNLSWDAYNKKLIYDGNNIYLYPKNGHYYFKRKIIRCKDRTTGEWYDAVLYSDANGQYVREVNDFNTKFKKI